MTRFFAYVHPQDEPSTEPFRYEIDRDVFIAAVPRSTGILIDQRAYVIDSIFALEVIPGDKAEVSGTFACGFCGAQGMTRAMLERHFTESEACGRNRNVNNPTRTKYGDNEVDGLYDPDRA